MQNADFETEDGEERLKAANTIDGGKEDEGTTGIPKQKVVEVDVLCSALVGCQSNGNGRAYLLLDEAIDLALAQTRGETTAGRQVDDERIGVTKVELVEKVACAESSRNSLRKAGASKRTQSAHAALLIGRLTSFALGGSFEIALQIFAHRRAEDVGSQVVPWRHSVQRVRRMRKVVLVGVVSVAVCEMRKATAVRDEHAPLPGDQTDDAIELGKVTLLDHPVRLVEHQVSHPLDRFGQSSILLDKIPQSTRRGNDDVRLTPSTETEHPLLLLYRHAASDGNDVDGQVTFAVGLTGCSDGIGEM